MRTLRASFAALLASSVAACGGSSGAADGAGPGADASPDAVVVDARVLDARPLLDAGPSNVASWNALDGVLPTAACAPWTLADTAEPEQVTLAAGALVYETSDDAELLYHDQQGAALAPGARITIKATLQVEAEASIHVNRTSTAIAVQLAGINRTAYLFIGDGVIFLGGLGGAAGPRGTSIALPTRDALHTYQLEIDTTALTVRALRDGVLVLEGVPLADEGVVVAVDRLYWGDISAFAHGRSRWESISHDAHATIVCP